MIITVNGERLIVPSLLVMEAIDAVVKHYLKDEWSHFQKEPRTDHIYFELKILENFLKEDS